jgi:glyoxylase-like metal-dependent hydrolase (beta-lactamase superfamily II)
MIDTGYLPEQSETLLQWSKTSLSAPIISALATHFHNDRTGGIAGLRKHGVRTLAYPLACQLALELKPRHRRGGLKLSRANRPVLCKLV